MAKSSTAQSKEVPSGSVETFLISGFPEKQGFRAIFDDFVFHLDEKSQPPADLRKKFIWRCVRRHYRDTNCTAFFFTSTLSNGCVPHGFSGFHNHEKVETLRLEYKNLKNYCAPNEKSNEDVKSRSNHTNGVASVKSQVNNQTVETQAYMRAITERSARVAQTNKLVEFEKGPADSTDLFADLRDEEERPDEYNNGKQGGAHMKIEIGNNIIQRYFIVRKAGFGNSAIAWLSFDKVDNRFCVLKIFKQPKDIYDEVQVLLKAKRLQGRPGSDKLVQMLQHFEINPPRNKRVVHNCIAFEPCGFTVLTVLGHSLTGFEPIVVRKMLKHCLEGLRFLHEDVGFIHTDIKPENILLSATDRSFFLEALQVVKENYNGKGMRASLYNAKPFNTPMTTMRYFQSILNQAPSPTNDVLPELIIPPLDENSMVTDEPLPRYRNIEQRLEINRELLRPATMFKICDIGNALKAGPLDADVATYEYRAPENIFRMPLTGTFDVWSLATTAVETIVRDQIFKPNRTQTEDNDALLQRMVDVLGDIPDNTFPTKIQALPSNARGRTLSENIANMFSGIGFTSDEITELTDVFDKLLTFDNTKRLSAADALKLSYFQDN